MRFDFGIVKVVRDPAGTNTNLLLGREPPTLPTLPSQRNPDSCATQIEAVRSVNIRCMHTYFEGIMAVEAARIIGLTAPHGRSPTRIEPETIPYSAAWQPEGSRRFAVQRLRCLK